MLILKTYKNINNNESKICKKIIFTWVFSVKDMKNDEDKG
jgi:hypothetical protein